MNDIEAELLIPSLCEKISFNNGFYYSIVSNILKDFCECYSHEKVYSLILCGLNSRSCAKSECLSELFKLYSAYKGNMTAKIARKHDSWISFKNFVRALQGSREKNLGVHRVY